MLTQKQERFCLEYFASGNATQAAIIAGYSPHTANEIAAQNLAKLSIKERMNELNEPIRERVEATVEAKLQKLETIYSREPKEVTVTDQIRAIAEHNKMGHVYETQPIIDNRKLILVVSKEAAEDMERIAERTGDDRQD